MGGGIVGTIGVIKGGTRSLDPKPEILNGH